MWSVPTYERQMSDSASTITRAARPPHVDPVAFGTDLLARGLQEATGRIVGGHHVVTALPPLHHGDGILPVGHDRQVAPGQLADGVTDREQFGDEDRLLANDFRYRPVPGHSVMRGAGQPRETGVLTTHGSVGGHRDRLQVDGQRRRGRGRGLAQLLHRGVEQVLIGGVGTLDPPDVVGTAPHRAGGGQVDQEPHPQVLSVLGTDPVDGVQQRGVLGGRGDEAGPTPKLPDGGVAISEIRGGNGDRDRLGWARACVDEVDRFGSGSWQRDHHAASGGYWPRSACGSCSSW